MTDTTATPQSGSTPAGSFSTKDLAHDAKDTAKDLAKDAKDTAKDLTTSDKGSVETSHGRTVIADTVVLKIAGIATREVSGVADLGRGAARAVGAIRERISGVGVDNTQGVSVEVGEKQAAVDVDIVAEYGVAISDLAEAIRTNVISAVERMTGLQVTEVNITVHDVALDDDADETSERVQ
ncbi:Asp23/Gls24 family envelope stress response protein [Arthrobacter sp. NEB 688]|uniref:Asp23/Gls24 family envelope stress response protein n=1 Tax=Arthrobacter sp. NEB 688 TaxID=904039 RepID=UPI001566642B|nr:Asp23/Gls24 family envelope stress response protein [Arthrobacter sp. NEB 688]QKE83156.1 Asp23/Gls24 family envelope stress response protein [Arthrobacter sp. NEB 688]